MNKTTEYSIDGLLSLAKEELNNLNNNRNLSFTHRLLSLFGCKNNKAKASQRQKIINKYASQVKESIKNTLNMTEYDAQHAALKMVTKAANEVCPPNTH